MGLDMYLMLKIERCNYSGRFDILNEDAQKKRALFDRRARAAVGISAPALNMFERVTASTQIGYWRKANHIHNWFVTNVQNGNDDCGSYSVEPEALDALELACKRALIGDTEALPPVEGFFFGGTEIGEWYYEDCRHTLKVIREARAKLRAFDRAANKAKRTMGGGEYLSARLEYHSSW